MSLPDTMSGVRLTGHGGPEKLVWSDTIPVPRPGPGEVLIRVRAAGVNNTDINTRIGWYAKEITGATADAIEGDIEAGGWSGALDFPRIQGADLCGTVATLGEGVDGPAIGSRVTAQAVQDWSTPDDPRAMKTLGSEMDGAFAEYCVVSAHQVFDVTASPLSDTEIAAMPCAFGTAWGMLDRAGVGPGDSVFVTGASGGVGLAAVMLARHLGATVIAQTSPAKADAVRNAGAATILDRGQIPEEGTVTTVIDLVGGPDWGRLLDALRPGGRLAVAGAIAGPIVQADLRTIYLKDLALHG
ncbi:MAG: zinc-binding dehydrogenase, partial [Silicimonas sp.]|nr:zinc-binding dehydrogenase [Silicimonas sp.]